MNPQSITAEGGTAGERVTLGGTSKGIKPSCITTSSDSSITYSSDTQAHGKQAYRVSVPTGGKAVLSNRAKPTKRLAGRFYLRFEGLPREAVAIAQTSNMAGQVVQIILSPSGQLSVRDVAGRTVYTANRNMSANTWYRVEILTGFGSNASNGTIQFAFYEGDSLDAIGYYTATNVDAGTIVFNYFSVGKLSDGTWDRPFYIDDIAYVSDATEFIGPVRNALPVANAGKDNTFIEPGSTVTLTGTDSDVDGTVASRQWRQISGVSVQLSGSGATRTYTAPATVSGTTLIFGYQVTDDKGDKSVEDTVKHVVAPSQQRAVIDNTEVPFVPVPVGGTPGDRGPVSFASLAEARTRLRAPSNANYVIWNPSWPANRDLEDVFATELGANDILVLPERAEPYIIDSSEGFRAAGVQSVTGRRGLLPIVNRYKGGRAARTWFAMARARRGILGLGPNARIEMSASSWRQEPQVEDKGSVQDDGWVSTGRYWYNTSGARQSELVGCQEKVIEAEHTSPYFGNFSLRTRDLGGVAYTGIASGGSNSTFERLDISSGWRGFLGVPNGESGGIGINKGQYLISKCVLGTRDGSGRRVGTSPIMINSSIGGRIEDTDASETFAGMLTIWNSSGKHSLANVNTRFNWGPGLNLEKCLAGFELEWIGGSNWSDYKGNGGKTPKPADQGTKGGLHVGINAPGGSAKITFVGVDFDNGPQAGAACIQGYGNSQQRAADIRRYDANGNSLPIRLF